MMKTIRSAVAALMLLVPATAMAQDVCHPTVDATKTQYIVGYGSLMETASKQRSTPDARPNHPVMVKGYQREWNTRGDQIGFSTTYLGVTIDADATMNAAIYITTNVADITATDEREAYYCRDAVAIEAITMRSRCDHDAITMLDGATMLSNSQAWVYYNKPDSRKEPNARWPIVQSYVDIFINGCIELERQVIDAYGNASFAEQCVLTTNGWSEHWVNDRLYPRRPFIYRKNAGSIDKLLHDTLPEGVFDAIRIE
jgi:hypothetical protein